MMKSMVIYHSKFGNTQRVAETIAGELKTSGAVQVSPLAEVSASDFQEAILVVMGSPTHKMNLPIQLRPYLDRLPKKLLKRKYFATFDTSYQMSWFLNRLTAGKKLAAKLRKLGGKQLVQPEIFLVQGKEGPLEEGEIERSKTWAQHLIHDLENRRKS